MTNSSAIKITNKKQKNKNKSIFAIVILVVLSLYALTFVVTIGVGLFNSVKGPQELMTGLPNPDANQQLFKGSYHLFYNYVYFFNSFRLKINAYDFVDAFGNSHVRSVGVDGWANIGHMLLNTFIYAIICPAITTIVSAVSGYLCNKYDYWYSKFIYVMKLVIMAIPVVGTQTSTMVLLMQLGIYDSYFAMFAMTANFGGLYFFMFYAHFASVSNTYIEAAELDGASQFGVLIRIMIPLAYKTMLTIYVIQLVALWNNYENMRVYFPTKPTLAYGVWKIAHPTGGATGIAQKMAFSKGFQLACCMVLSLPTLVMFACLKNVLMGNLTLGGLKE